MLNLRLKAFINTLMKHNSHRLLSKVCKQKAGVNKNSDAQIIPLCFSHLSYVVVTILATDGFDGTDIQPSEDLCAGINPQFIPVTEGIWIRSTESQNLFTGNSKEKKHTGYHYCTVCIITVLLRCKVGT